MHMHINYPRWGNYIHIRLLRRPDVDDPSAIWRPRSGEPWRKSAHTLHFRKPRVIVLHFCRWHYGSISIRLALVISQKCEVAQNFDKIWLFSNSRSPKVIDFGTNRKRTYDFLSVINSNHGPVLHRKPRLTSRLEANACKRGNTDVA